MSLSTFSFPTAITFGAGARKKCPGHLRQHGCTRPLLVTDRGLADRPLVRDFVLDLEQGGLHVSVFGEVHGNPTAAQVEAGAKAFHHHRADAVIGLGGGAALDVAKAVALMSCHPGAILDYAFDHPEARPINQPLPPLFALPTTSGTGSEVGRSAVISDAQTHVKRIIFAPVLLPRAVFADPELTLELPPALTAATGIDALTHHIESYLSPVYHPICDGIALEGLRLGARALAAAVADGSDISARSDMMMCALMGGIAFQKDLGAVHACAHALSAVKQLHHGLANALMLEPVLRFNASAAPAKFAEMARVTGAGTTADDLLRWLADLQQRIGLPRRLGAVGVTAADLPLIADVASRDSCRLTNPRPCSRDDFERLLHETL
jgi:alcohol dehydrogenase class IV